MSASITKNELAEIKTLHGEIMDHARTSLEKAMRIGELLFKLRGGDSGDHGKWLLFVKDNLPFSDQTARNYIRLHEQRDEPKFKNVLNLNLSEAYRLLSAPGGAKTHRSPKKTEAQKRREMSKTAYGVFRAISRRFEKWDEFASGQRDVMESNLAFCMNLWPDSFLRFLRDKTEKHLANREKNQPKSKPQTPSKI